MATIEVKCPICGSTNVIEYGKSKSGKQRYCCKNNKCPRKIFQLEYRYNGCKPGIDDQIVDMTVNASGIRDISRVLKITTDKVISTLKKQRNNSVILTWHISVKGKLHTIFSLMCFRLRKSKRPNWMRCGVLSFPRRISDGCGWRLITKQAKYWHTHSGGVKTRFFILFRQCLSLSLFPCFILMIGEVIKGAFRLFSMSSARNIRRRLSVRTWPCVLISSDYAENPSAFPSLWLCTILSLGWLSTSGSLD